MGDWVTLTDPEYGLGDVPLAHLHLNGLTQNYVVGLEHPEQDHLPTRFHTYNLMCLESFDNIDPNFLPTMAAYKNTLPQGFTPDEKVMSFF